MDINKKLEYYKSSPKQSIDNQKTELPSSLKALAEHFNGEILFSTAPVLKITRVYKIKDLMNIDNNEPSPHSLYFLKKNSGKKNLELQNCLFFDLETTGLMGGAGTFPFLLGFGKFDSGNFVVNQYFLPEFGREYYLYKDLQNQFKHYDTLVSFNGKSYDLPLLKSRFIMNHMIPDFDKTEHLDLLHISRRIWKDSIPSCDLISIESNVLNRQRFDDIPGWLIPQAYFDFLNYGLIHDIQRIIEHNYFDIVSLADLVFILSEINSNPAGLKDPKSLMRLAGLAFELGDSTRFEEICSALSNLESWENQQIKVWKSLLHKRNFEWKDAIFIWNELIQTKEHSFFALEELAKYSEHQEKLPQKALDFSERALKKINIIKELEYFDEKIIEIENRFLYRKERLLSKIS